MPGELLRAIAGPAAGTEIALGAEVVFGRSAQGAGTLAQDNELSRRHARVVPVADGTLVLEDLGSTNGTYLNGWRIPAPQRLAPGDRIQLGQTVLEVSGGAQADSASWRQPAILEGAAPAQVAQTAVLRAEAVWKSYGDHQVLNGLDLEVQPGEIVGLLGANGAGKTTFVSIVAGLRPADYGTIVVNGVDALSYPRQARAHIGLAPQDLGIYPTISVRRNLEVFAEISGVSKHELAGRVEEVGDALSLTPLFDRAAGALSGGQKRRLHTGMAILHRPALMILDEPTVGADVRTRQEIIDLVRRLADEGHAVCYSTHYMPEVEALGASVAILQGGQIIARGSIAELIATHSSQAVELHFDGPPPQLRLEGAVSVEDSTIRVVTADPASVVSSALEQLGAMAVRLRDLEIIRPSLESVYLSLTERRYSDEEARAAARAQE